MAMMVVLLGSTDGEVCLRPNHIYELARLGVTNVALLRDEQAVGIVGRSTRRSPRAQPPRQWARVVRERSTRSWRWRFRPPREKEEHHE